MDIIFLPTYLIKREYKSYSSVCNAVGLMVISVVSTLSGDSIIALQHGQYPRVEVQQNGRRLLLHGFHMGNG